MATSTSKSSFSYQKYESLPEDERVVPSKLKYSRYSTFGIVLMIVGTVLLLIYLAFSNPSTLQSTSLSKTTPFKSVSHPDPPTSYWGSVAKPYPTGAFWTNLVVDGGNGVVGVYPYGVVTNDSGIQVSYGSFRRITSHSSVTDYFGVDLEISSIEPFKSRYVSGYTNLSVSVTYETTGVGTFRTHLVKSSPYLTVEYHGATPVIRSVMLILFVEPKIVQGSSGTQYLVTLGNYQKWLVYCSDPTLQLYFNGNTLTAAGPITGFIRVAVLPLQNFDAAFTFLMQYVNKYATGATLSINFVPDSATLTYEYTTVGEGSLLMLALPHHLPLIQSPVLSDDIHTNAAQILTPLYSIKGQLTPVIGDSWTMVYPLVSVGWDYVINEALSIQQLDTIATNLMFDVNTIQPNDVNPYTFGKQASRMAAIALLADNLGIVSVRQTALSNLETAMIPWLLNNDRDVLVYDHTYGGIVPQQGLKNKLSFFGSGWYSDHHFHYGYFIYAAAVLARLAPIFYANYVTEFDAILRDYCTIDATDTDYPFVRHKDFFDGHSWASGLFQQGNGKGQESSSEAVNAYYGAYLYSLATNNNELGQMSRLLMSMEVHSAKAYWHMKTAPRTWESMNAAIIDDFMYDNVFASTLMVGNIGALDVTASTWFGNDLKFVHGINMMPLTPATALLFDVDYVLNQYPVLASSLPTVTLPDPSCANNPNCAGLIGDCCPTPQANFLECCEGAANNPLQDEFISYVYADQAIVNRDDAWNNMLKQSSFGVGNSRSNALFWAATRAPAVMQSVQMVNVTNYAAEVLPACLVNSACNVLGIVGDCCPTDQGVTLGCCPFTN